MRQLLGALDIFEAIYCRGLMGDYIFLRLFFFISSMTKSQQSVMRLDLGIFG